MNEKAETNAYQYSGEWWLAQDEASLEYLIRNNFPGNSAYEGAQRELQRRQTERREKVNRRIAWGSFIAAIIAAVASVVGLFLAR